MVREFPAPPLQDPCRMTRVAAARQLRADAATLARSCRPRPIEERQHAAKATSPLRCVAYGPDLCTDPCELAPYCGDGIVNGFEQCDGDAACTPECTPIRCAAETLTQHSVHSHSYVLEVPGRLERRE
jgi:hypothetical protein